MFQNPQKNCLGYKKFVEGVASRAAALAPFSEEVPSTGLWRSINVTSSPRSYFALYVGRQIVAPC